MSGCNLEQREVVSLTLPPPDTCRGAFARDGYVFVQQCGSTSVLADLSAAAARVARHSSISIDRRPEGSDLVYRVVSGDRLAAEAPLLFDLYRSPHLLAWIASVRGTNRYRSHRTSAPPSM